MSEWIKLHAAVFVHPKTRRMAKRLGVSPAAVVGHLASLWCWALEYAPDGDLTRFDSEELEVAAGWEGPEDAFIAAAVTVGYLDRIEDGEHVETHIHDWAEWGGSIVERKTRERQRAAERRMAARQRPAGTPTSARRPHDVATTTRVASESDVDDNATTISVASESDTESDGGGGADDGHRLDVRRTSGGRTQDVAPRSGGRTQAEEKRREEKRREEREEKGLNPLATADALADADDDVIDVDFEEWWGTYGRVGSKADAARLYGFWRAKGAEAADLLAAARVYRAHCECTDCKMQHARTFLAKPPKGGRARWYEWAEGEEHGAMDVRATERLAEVFDTAAHAFGLSGGRDDNGSRRQLTGGPTRAPQRRAHAGGGVPARELAAGE